MIFFGDQVPRHYRVVDPRTGAKELKAFAKVAVQPGEWRDVSLALDMRSLAYFDDARQAWVAQAGEFELQIGTSSAELPYVISVQLTGEWSQAVSVADT